tara:strand:+ start:123 stop:506 length:384 start_codon:yes stop_codon:yes gene_type:complete
MDMSTNINNISYEKYLTDSIESFSKNFGIKSYKLASQEEWMGFERGRDLRIQIQWKGECIWEWVTEKALWVQRNTNKEDRMWMRRHADIKIDLCKNALVKKNKKESTNDKKKTVSNTQDLFEKMKKQ